jgi:RHS repeat-associated protein
MARRKSIALKSMKIIFAIIPIAIIFILSNSQCSADDASPIIQDSATGVSMIGVNGEALPDLFTGAFTYRIPLEVPPGRNGLQPKLALVYKSSNGKGWIGKGWELEIGSIERNTRFGVNYARDDYIFRTSDGASELVNIGGEYRAKVEKDFIRIRKLTSAYDGRPFWEATDKSGTIYMFGRFPQTRQDDPANPDRIFKWCLDRVDDRHGNYMTMGYVKDRGQIYLRRIYYTGNINDERQPTNYLDFAVGLCGNCESTYDYSYSHVPNFNVQTVARLLRIVIRANADMGDEEGDYGGELVRIYDLQYDTSPATGQYLLKSVQELGKDWSVLSEHKFDWWSKSGSKGLMLTNNAIYDSQGNNMSSLINGKDYWPYEGDFSGDGKTDILATVMGVSTSKLISSNGDGSWNVNSSIPSVAPHPVRGDFNADGKMDLLYATSPTIHVYFGTRDGTLTETNFPNAAASWMSRYHEGGTSDNRYIVLTTIITGDFNGDGKTDILLDYDELTTTPIYFSNGDGTFKVTNNTIRDSQGNDISKLINLYGTAVYTGDFNGDGKTDLLLVNKTFTTNPILFSNGDGTFTISNNAFSSELNGLNSRVITGDFDGDGKTDIYVNQVNDYFYYPTDDCGDGTMFFSRGDGTWHLESRWTGSNYHELCLPRTQVIPGDFNGDGKTDLLLRNNDPYIGFNNTPILFSRGDGSFDVTRDATTIINDPEFNPYPLSFIITGDFHGKGKTDIALHIHTSPAPNTTPIFSESNIYPDLLNGIKNSIGGKTTIEYKPSTSYQNPQLPFPVYTLSSVTNDDGNGNLSKTEYTFSGGYYHIGERDFRGFNYAKVTGPMGVNGEQLITETWFHQGKDTVVDVNDPNVSDGYMKGKPYRVLVTDAQGDKYSEVTTTYAADVDNKAPYFNPPLQVDRYVYDGGTDYKQIRTVYTYDGYGNITREDQYGDYNDQSDDRTIIRTFSPNTSDWIVGLPTKEDTYQGIGTANKVAGKTFYYDDLTDCNGTPTNNQTPVKGNMTRVVGWLNGGVNPETRKAYDGYGNPVCSRDAKGNVTRIGYDGSLTFPRIITNPLGQQTKTQYYGVDAVLSDNGLYGQIKSVTDPNEATTAYQYDIFGRQTNKTRPDGSWTAWSYNNFGTVGSQNVLTNTSAGLWSVDYFDGLGRTYKNRSSGPDSKTIVTETHYDARGAVTKSSLPYFEGAETPRYTMFVHDSPGRAIKTTNPDMTRTLACYDRGVLVSIDPNNHRKRETRDVYDRLVKVEEYKGIFDVCSTEVGSPYTTTTYQYDALGNLRFVTDTKGNQTEMCYDTLGRKTFMRDPDMGDWYYTYDANGNLATQTDAKLQTIRFSYDSLNRPTLKDYPAGTDVIYTYDEPTSTYGKGRLTTMTDASGKTTYSYDSVGRVANTTKTVDGKDYPLTYAYDKGRLYSITYPPPNNETVTYTYDTGGNLLTAGGYATYTDYNALGQPQTVTFGNHVITKYSYYNANYRLYSITTTTPSQLMPLVDLKYVYDNKGNIQSITDSVHSTVPHNFTGQTYSLYSGKAHAYGISGRSFQYDANGNMTSDGQRTITYDYENMPKTINGNVSFVYDGKGNRVRKIITPTLNRVYIDKFLTCDGAVCAKFIYSGNTRIALKDATQTNYYHPDHLGSTFIVTNSGSKVEDITYDPFGEISSDTGTFRASHLYTSQELDGETGLYNYNARLYDPETGRFVSPDTIAPDPANPQGLNRYAYTLNNPLKYVDPTGHSTWINEHGYVQRVINDHDLTIYQTVEGQTGPIGKTHFWDSFTDGRGNSEGHINIGMNFTGYMLTMIDSAMDMTLPQVAWESRNGGAFDIKTSWPGFEGNRNKAYEGGLFKGEYITLRDGGNIIFGANTFIKGLTRDQAMRAAGGYQKAGFLGALTGLLGKEHGNEGDKYFGEDAITGSRVDYGFSIASSLMNDLPDRPLVDIGFRFYNNDDE